MTKEKIIETIKKLLALAGSNNENESRLAMQRAQEMIAKHSVSIIDDVTDKVQEIQINYTRLCVGSEQAAPNIMFVVCKIFGVHVLIKHHKTTVGLIGFETNIKVALHASDCIIHQLNNILRTELKKKHKEWIGPNFINDYWLAASDSLHKRFIKETEIGKGLIIYDKANEFMHSRYKVISGIPEQFANTNGVDLGKKAGNEAQLRRGVETQSNERKLL